VVEEEVFSEADIEAVTVEDSEVVGGPMLHIKISIFRSYSDEKWDVINALDWPAGLGWFRQLVASFLSYVQYPLIILRLSSVFSTLYSPLQQLRHARPREFSLRGHQGSPLVGDQSP